MDIEYKFLPGSRCSADILERCSSLFSNHYGVWSSGKGRVMMSGKRIGMYLSKPDTSLYYAEYCNEMIGYAIAFRRNINGYGHFSWVTQLVVHSDHRHKGVATTLLRNIWQMSDDYAWGIVTSNPYAVRALEDATRRCSIPMVISKNLDAVMLASENTTYITKDTERRINDACSQFNTQFFVSHTGLESRLKNVTQNNRKWLLGDELPEGWEWAAFTFKEQEPAEYTADEMKALMDGFDDVTHSAYALMRQTGQPWAKYAGAEIDMILSETKAATAIDFGCGEGRHSAELSKRGLDVTAVDYVREKTDRIKAEHPDITVICDDCRTVNMGITADLCLCLYDVIGSFVESEDNQKILDNISRHLKAGGAAYISVMNYEMTAHKMIHTFQFRTEYNKLLALGTSDKMSTTGNIFDFEHSLVDTENHIVYRKERFEFEGMEPTEHIVRDRRFTGDELRQMCEKAGLCVDYIKYVNAGKWGQSLPNTEAKEILVRCTKK